MDVRPEPPRTAGRATTHEKILPLNEAADIVGRLKQQGKTIVLCHGVFDLVHPGHIKHLQAAKREGDHLIVSLTADQFVNKGPGRPIFSERLRAESLAALEVVGHVTISRNPTATEVISRLRPDIYVKGDEYANAGNDITGKIVEEEEAVRAVGGRIHFTNEDTYSSSNLINEHVRMFPPSTEDWLRVFRKAHPAAEIVRSLAALSELRVLVVGEAIIDEYVFCNALGKSAKDPIIAFQYDDEETYLGGSLAVANHLAGLVKNVGVLTLLGNAKNREYFIRECLRPNVSPNFIIQNGVPTIHKKRFIDRHSGNKLFELYEMNDSALPPDVEAELISSVERMAGDYDVVIVTDYGHAMMTSDVIRAVCGKARFLAVNTQVNAGNRGFNTVTRYPRADYVSIAGNELELEIRTRGRSFTDLLTQLADRINCPRFTVTLGKDGTIHFEKGRGFVEAPALAVQVLDRVGAGDAVLSVTAPLVMQGVDWNVVGFLANLAGAEMVGHLGNRVALERVALSKHTEALLK